MAGILTLGLKLESSRMSCASALASSGLSVDVMGVAQRRVKHSLLDAVTIEVNLVTFKDELQKVWIMPAINIGGYQIGKNGHSIIIHARYRP